MRKMISGSRREFYCQLCGTPVRCTGHRTPDRRAARIETILRLNLQICNPLPALPAATASM